MKTNPLKNSRINIITFGCAKNTYDSVVLSGKLATYGVEVVHEAPFKKNDILASLSGELSILLLILVIFQKERFLSSLMPLTT